MSNEARRIALVHPHPNLRTPNANEPLTILTLGGILQKEGFDVSVIDGAIVPITPDLLSPYNVIAVTAKTAQYTEAVKILNMAKEVNKGVHTIVGGPHITVFRDKVMQDGWTAACAGEGDLVIADMILNRTKGFIQGEALKDLNAIPFPARDLIEPGKYIREGMSEPSISVLTMRGCPYVCIYCARDAVGRLVRYRSPENVVAEITEVVRKYGTKNVIFYDDTFTVNKKRAIKLSKKLGELGVSWLCNTRVDQVDPEVLAAMKAGGCTEISFGVESANNRVLEFAHKGITVEKAYKAVQMAKDAGILTRVFLMYGFYEDGMDSAKDMITFLHTAQPDAARLSLLVPMPGTEVYERAKEFGIELPQNMADYQYVGVDGPQTFIKKTKYLNEEQFPHVVEELKRGFVDWALKRNSGAMQITNVQRK